MKTLLAVHFILAQAPQDVEVVRDVEFGKGGERTLQKAGVDSTFTVQKDQGHGFRGGDPEQAVEAFFDRVLKAKK